MGWIRLAEEGSCDMVMDISFSIKYEEFLD
jgi:hypothetical protein